MLGAIAGDIIGSVYEGHNIKSVDFPLFGPWNRFTDDTVLTVAIADAILTGADYGEKLSVGSHRNALVDSHPHRGYGRGFRRWAAAKHAYPGNSFGNGSPMRVSPVGWAFNTLDEVLEEAKRTAEPSHGHDEPIDEIRRYYPFDVTCPRSPLQALSEALQSKNFEDAVRGDSDTTVCNSEWGSGSVLWRGIG